MTDVASGHHAVIGSPVVHHFVGRSKRATTGNDRCEPSGRPSRIGSVVQRIVNVIGQLDRVTFGDLQSRTKSVDKVNSSHRGRHSATSPVASTESTAGKVLGDRRMPSRRLEAFLDFFVTDLPKRLHRWVTVYVRLLAGSVERCRSGINQMQKSVGRVPIELVTITSFRDRIGTPVGSQVGKDLC